MQSLSLKGCPYYLHSGKMKTNNLFSRNDNPTNSDSLEGGQDLGIYKKYGECQC